MKAVLKNTLLFSQLEMAILLGISRSQWSMYVLGLRNLPYNALQKLAPILEISNAPDFLKRRDKEKEKNVLKDNVINSYFREVKFQQLKLKRQLAQVELRYEIAINTLHFISQYEATSQQLDIINLVKKRALVLRDKNGLAGQELLKIKIKGFEIQEISLLQLLKEKLM